MKRNPLHFTASCAIALCLSLFVSRQSRADYITDNDIVTVDNNAIRSGNGTLDIQMFTDAQDHRDNSQSGVDVDDANTNMPKGNADATANESWITSIGELRDFYILNFPDNAGGSTVNEIVLFLDLNQKGGPQATPLILDNLTIVVNYTQDFGDDRDDPAGTDISSDLQELTGNSYSGATVIAELDESAKSLPLIETGAGFADYMIFTHINPFDNAFNDDTPILFHWESRDHVAGGETVFLSGAMADDVIESPEPATLFLVGTGLVGVLGFLRRRRVA